MNWLKCLVATLITAGYGVTVHGLATEPVPGTVGEAAASVLMLVLAAMGASVSAVFACHYGLRLMSGAPRRETSGGPQT